MDLQITGKVQMDREGPGEIRWQEVSGLPTNAAEICGDLMLRGPEAQLRATFSHFDGLHLQRPSRVGATASEILQSTSRRLHVKQLELDEVNIKVCLKWVRFVLYYYCGGIQAMSLGDVMRVRLSRPSQYLIKAEMAALEITDSEEGHEEQDLELHQSLEVIHRTVDEDALMRVEQGLDLALARGLSLEPTDLALEPQWMGILSNLGCLEDRRMLDLTVVGTHDAAAYWLSDRAAQCGPRCHACQLAPISSRQWGLAQGGSLLEQLRSGVRPSAEFLGSDDQWWHKPLKDIQMSQQRLVVLVQTSYKDWTGRLKRDGVRYLQPIDKSLTMAADGSLSPQLSSKHQWKGREPSAATPASLLDHDLVDHF
eukprot:g26004.t1